MNKKLKKYVLTAMLAALTMIATGMLPKIPVPATGGYVHLGDTVIIVASMLFGPWVGALSAAIGSALADLIAGYAQYIIPTFIIKGLMGFVVGKLSFGNHSKLGVKQLCGLLFGGIIMVGGYYIFEIIMTSSVIVPLEAVPFNIMQYAVGTVLGLILYFALKDRINKI